MHGVGLSQLYSQLGCRTIGLRDYWAVGLLGCMSDYWDVPGMSAIKVTPVIGLCHLFPDHRFVSNLFWTILLYQQGKIRDGKYLAPKILIFFRDVISLLARVFILLIDTATQEVPMKNI